MAKRLDKILVVDVESTCWPGTPPEGQTSEIIEVGVCTVDVATLVRADKRSILIKPVQSEISAFCTELTTIPPEMVADAGTLADACGTLRSAYRATHRGWASWGDYDRNQFERVCAAQGVDYPFGATHLNVKALFALATGARREVGMVRALETLGLPLEGTHHRGGDDAWNIANVLCHLLARMRAT